MTRSAACRISASMAALYIFIGMLVSTPTLLAQIALESEVAETVSLSPAKIVEILRREPGLLLEAKKALVKRAFQQGRLLEEADLTDDALFRLVHTDTNIRALVTQQIVRRRYITAKPTPEETEQKLAEQARKAALNKQSGVPSQTEPAEGPTETGGSEVDAPIPTQRSGRGSRNNNSQPRELPSVKPDELPRLLQKSEQRGVDESESPSAASAEAMASARGTELSSERELLSGERRTPRFRRLPAPIVNKKPVNPELSYKDNPYANLPSLRDQYSQMAASPELSRFGADIFKSGTGNTDDLPMDLPMGPDYVLGPGDGLNIELWGGISQRMQRVVDREGKVALPEVGTIMVAGSSLSRVQELLQAELRRQFHDVRVDVSIARLRSIRVFVVGDVEHPGAFDISSLSSPLNAIFVAGGPTSLGSIRTIKHFRGKQLVQEIDSYDLILNGATGSIQRLQSGDTVLVPPIGPEITLEGMVRRPAIYELKGELNLEDALSLSGGVLPNGSMSSIEIDRLDSHQKRSMVNFALTDTDNNAISASLRKFTIKGGDKIRISAIRPGSERSVFLEGHVFLPGKYSYADNMRVMDLIQRSGKLLPEPFRSYAEVVRLSPGNLRPQVIAFNLGDAIDGKDGSNLELQPLDTVRVFGRFDFEDTPKITVTGEVRNPGEHSLKGDISLRDAVFVAGGLTPDAMLDDAQVFRRQDGQTKVLSVNLRSALSGEAADNITLLPQDRLIIHRNLAKMDPPTVFVRGEVANPGKYPLGQNMTVSQLVRLAGGFKRGAYLERADLSRFNKEGDERVVGENLEISLTKVFSGAESDIPLKDGDTLSIRQITGFGDFGAAITVRGEVIHPSTYGIKPGEKLSSILQRAGGFRSGAYPQGAVLERAQIRELEEKAREDLVRRLDEEEQSFSTTPNVKPQEEIALRQAFIQQHALILTKLKNAPPVGRLVVKISPDIAKWQDTPADIEVRAGDIITIPKRPTHILVSGQVYNPSAQSYRPGKSARWYLSQSGGPTSLGNKKGIFVIRADGSVVGGGGSSWWGGDPLSVTLNPGDAVVVPEKILTGNSTLKSLAETAQIVSTMAIAASIALR